MEIAHEEVVAYWSRELAVCRWIEEVVETQLTFEPSSALREGLRDGVLMCKLLNRLRDGTVPEVNEARAGLKLPHYRARKNMTFFLSACEEDLGIPRALLFRPNDLLFMENVVRVVNTLVIVAVAFESAGGIEAGMPRFSREIEPAEVEQFLASITMVLREKTFRCIQSEEARIQAYLDKQSKGPTERRESDAEATSRQSSFEMTIEKVDMDMVERGVTRLQAIVRGRQARAKFAKLQRHEAYRFRIAMEMLTTEQAYNYNLQLLTEYFLEPLLQHGADQILSPLRPMKASLEIIRGYSVMLLRNLQTRVQQWSRSQQLGGVFLEVSDFLKVYTEYVMHYTKCAELLSGAVKHVPDLARLIHALERDPVVADSKWPFESYLMQPVQRIPRYELLIRELLRNTDEDHPDHDPLQRAEKKIAEVNAHVNQQQQQTAALSRVWDVAEMFGKQLTEADDGVDELFQSYRRFVKEGVLKFEGRKCMCFLFSDILIVGSRMPFTRAKQLKLRRILWLRGHEVRVEGDGPRGTIIFEKNDQMVAQFFCASEADRIRWFEEIYKTVTAANKAKSPTPKRDKGAPDKVSKLEIPANVNEQVLLDAHREESARTHRVEVGEAQWSAAKTMPKEIMEALKEKEMERATQRSFVTAGVGGGATAPDASNGDSGGTIAGGSALRDDATAFFTDEGDEDDFRSVLMMAKLTAKARPIDLNLDDATWVNKESLPAALLQALAQDGAEQRKARRTIEIQPAPLQTEDSTDGRAKAHAPALGSPGTKRRSFSLSLLSRSKKMLSSAKRAPSQLSHSTGDDGPVGVQQQHLSEATQRSPDVPTGLTKCASDSDPARRRQEIRHATVAEVGKTMSVGATEVGTEHTDSELGRTVPLIPPPVPTRNGRRRASTAGAQQQRVVRTGSLATKLSSISAKLPPPPVLPTALGDGAGGGTAPPAPTAPVPRAVLPVHGTGKRTQAPPPPPAGHPSCPPVPCGGASSQRRDGGEVMRAASPVRPPVAPLPLQPQQLTGVGGGAVARSASASALQRLGQSTPPMRRHRPPSGHSARRGSTPPPVAPLPPEQ